LKNTAQYLFLASGLKNGEGFWIIGIKNCDENIIEDKNLLDCHRKELIGNSLNNLLESKNLSQQSIAGFATIDIKIDEKGILELAKEKNLPVKFFSKEDLSKIIVPNPSSVVEKEIGTPTVAEASSLLAAGEEAKLLEEK